MIGRYDIAKSTGCWIVLDTCNRYMVVGRYLKRSEAVQWVRKAEGR